MSVEKVLLVLSDGKFHSGETIAKQLDISRTSVWKHIDKLRNLGADIYSVKGKGYRVPGGLDLLDKETLSSQLEGVVLNQDLHLLTNIASTNKYLMLLKSSDCLQVCTAEYQSAGRGRLGRAWHSPFARNLYLSLRIQLPIPMDALSGFSLAVGCGVASSLKSLGAIDIKLKWPNDLRINKKKVGGILVELANQEKSKTDVIVGIGLNWEMPGEQPIDQQWANLKPYCQVNINRNDVISAVIKSVSSAFHKFVLQKFEGFKSEWNEYDELVGKPVKLISNALEIRGVCRGVDDQGAVIIETGNELSKFIGGELSLREIE